RAFGTHIVDDPQRVEVPIIFTYNHKMAAIRRPDNAGPVAFFTFLLILFIIAGCGTAVITTLCKVLPTGGGNLMFLNGTFFFILAGLLVVFAVHPRQVIVPGEDYPIGVGREGGPRKVRLRFE